MKIPDNIKGFVDSLSQLPGIGPRQATRIAFYLAASRRDAAYSLARAAEKLGELSVCPRCFYIHEGHNETCEVCANPTRDGLVIAIVEKETDVLSMENTGKFEGVYLVVGGIKKTGGLSEIQKARLEALKRRIASTPRGKAKEIIMALSPTTFGDIASRMVEQEIAECADKTTKLGRGIPTGGEIEFADPETLGEAIRRRE